MLKSYFIQSQYPITYIYRTKNNGLKLYWGKILKMSILQQKTCFMSTMIKIKHFGQFKILKIKGINDQFDFNYW